MTTGDLQQANEETREAWNQNAAFWDERMGEDRIAGEARSHRRRDRHH